MRKRRKVLVILGLIAVVAVCFVILQPPDEPKYQGRYLSEWMAIYERHELKRSSPELAEAQKAVQTIGTNALPYFLKWMQHEPSPWRESLSRKLPSWIADNPKVERFIFGAAQRRVYYGNVGLQILGTNAFGAMPELEAMMRDRTKPFLAIYAMEALTDFGEPAIPVFQRALADPHQADRDRILDGVGWMASKIGTNKCLPILVAALTDDDTSVRSNATNILRGIAPEVLTNAPAP